MNDRNVRKGCLWPMWAHDARPNHEYCGKHRTEDSSYCEAHRRLSIRDLEKEPRQTFVPRRRAA